MSHYIKEFLETELTAIPSVMDNLTGQHYNNALFNGVTWLIFILYVMHFTFDVTVNALLRKMRFKEYVRIRLRKSLWYLGFYSCSFLYCCATLWKNNIKYPHRYKFTILDLEEPISGHLILGYALLVSFYASSSIWEGLHCSFLFFTYLFLFGFVAFTYFLRYIELAVLLAATFSFIQVITELTRCTFSIFKGESNIAKFLLNGMFCISVLGSGLVYFVIIPTSFVLPLARGAIRNSDSITLIGLNLSIWGWLVCEIYSSPIYRLIQHRWYHSDAEMVPNCLGFIMECALFFPRNDSAYNYRIMKQEYKERQAKLLALRKPKGAATLFQTLKCVAAINRKIKYRKLLANLPVESPESSPEKLQEEQSEEELVDSDDVSFMENSNLRISSDEDEDYDEVTSNETFDIENEDYSSSSEKFIDPVSLWHKQTDIQIQQVEILQDQDTSSEEIVDSDESSVLQFTDSTK